MKMGIVILYVRDIQKAKAFYTEVVGLPVIEEQSDVNFIMLRPTEGSLLALEDISVLPAGQAKEPGSIEVGLEVADADAVWQRWKSHGVEMVTELEDKPFGRTFLAKDPEGHYLTVYAPGQR
jgi:predicted enzyme related to lactoylglutathione lyase